MDGYKDIIERVTKKVNIMINEIESGNTNLNEILTDLYEIKDETESMGTRPRINLKGGEKNGFT